MIILQSDFVSVRIGLLGILETPCRTEDQMLELLINQKLQTAAAEILLGVLQ